MTDSPRLPVYTREGYTVYRIERNAADMVRYVILTPTGDHLDVHIEMDTKVVSYPSTRTVDPEQLRTLAWTLQAAANEIA